MVTAAGKLVARWRLARPDWGRPLAVGLEVGWPALAGLVAAQAASPYWQTIGVGMGVYGAAAVGLSVMLRYGGMPSFAQGSFVGLGMYAVAKSPWGYGIESLVFALAVGLLAAGLVGLLAMRVQHMQFLLATLAVALIGDQLVRALVQELGGPSGLPVPSDRPFGLRSNADYLLAVSVLLSVLLLLARLLKRSRFAAGASLIGHDEVLSRVVGVASQRSVWKVFVLGSMMAVCGGALYAHFLLWVTPHHVSLLPNAELLLAAIIGGNEPSGAIVGIVLLKLVPDVARIDPSAQLMIFGGILALTALLFPDGLQWRQIARVQVPRLWLLLSRYGPGAWRASGPRRPLATAHGRRPARPSVPPPMGTPASQAPAPGRRVSVSLKGGPRPRGPGEAPTLQLEEVRIRFGGVRAVDGVSLRLGGGKIVAVIGPNGAGKTSLLNYASGLVPGQGRVLLGERDITRVAPELRAGMGLSRTFQFPRLLPGFTVWEVVVAGAYRLGRGGLLAGLTGLDWQEVGRLNQAAAQALELCNIGHLRDEPIEACSGAELKLVDLARALAARPSLLLLDEPVAGTDPDTRARIASLLQRLVGDGCGIMLVEHDLDFVVEVADEVLVMDQGRVIMGGEPATVMHHPEVIRVYIGQ
jgi:branched-chain amino acid transport system permease protein